MPWAMGVTKWFICLFADVLLPETTYRVWDCLFNEGSKILFRVSLSLIIIHKQEIIKSTDLSELVAIFKHIECHPQVIHCHNFMKVSF